MISLSNQIKDDIWYQGYSQIDCQVKKEIRYKIWDEFTNHIWDHVETQILDTIKG